MVIPMVFPLLRSFSHGFFDGGNPSVSPGLSVLHRRPRRPMRRTAVFFWLGKHHLIWGKHWRIWCVVWWRRGTDSANCDLFMLKMLKEIAIFIRKILEHVEDNVENCDVNGNGTNMETDWKHGRETMGKILMIHGRTCKKHLRNLFKPQLITAFFSSSMVPNYVPVRSCKCWFNRFIPWKIWNIAERIDESRTHQLQFLVIYCRL